MLTKGLYYCATSCPDHPSQPTGQKSTSVFAGGLGLCTAHCLPAFTYKYLQSWTFLFQANVFHYNITNTFFWNWDLYITRQMLYFGTSFTSPIKSKPLLFWNWQKMSTDGITDICTKHFHLCVRITGDQVCTLEDTLSEDSQPHKRKLQILLATNSHSLQI